MTELAELRNKFCLYIEESGSSNVFYNDTIPDELKLDKEVFIHLAKHNKHNGIKIPVELSGDTELAKKMIAINALWFEKFNKDVQDDKEICLLAIRTSKNGEIFTKFPSKMKKNKKVVLEAVKKDVANYAASSKTKDIREDNEIIEATLAKDGRALILMPESVKDHIQFVSIAMTWNPLAIEFASDRLKNNLEVAEQFINSVSYKDDATRRLSLDGFYQFSTEVRSNHDFISDAINVHGLYLIAASDELKADLELVNRALDNLKGKENETVTLYSNIDVALRTNKELTLKAVTTNGRALESASYRLRDDIEVVRVALKSNPLAYEFISTRLQDNTELLSMAVSSTKSSYASHIVSSSSQRLKDLIAEQNPKEALNKILLKEKIENESKRKENEVKEKIEKI